MSNMYNSTNYYKINIKNNSNLILSNYYYFFKKKFCILILNISTRYIKKIVK